MTFHNYVGFLDNLSNDSTSAPLTDVAATFTPSTNGFYLLNTSVDAYVAVNETATDDSTPLWAKTGLTIKLRGPAQDYAGDTLSYIRQGASDGMMWITRILPG
jgi:hypothetical protein